CREHHEGQPTTNPSMRHRGRRGRRVRRTPVSRALLLRSSCRAMSSRPSAASSGRSSTSAAAFDPGRSDNLRRGRPRMAVRYVRVNPVVDLFSPVIRATGNMAIVGNATVGTNDVPVQVATPADAATAFGVPAGSDLTRAIQLAFQQTP